MSVFGCDYAWGRPGPAALTKAGVKFACRYLSHDTSGKNLTLAEAKQLSAAGIWVVVVWETTASRALSGRAGGVSDAQSAAAQAKACGMPGDRPIYFAVDWDASASQQATINAYLDGAAAVIGRDRVGMYAGYGPIVRAFDAGKITWGWQTYAWSGGRWDTRAQLQQYLNDQRINGVGLDYDRAMYDDYGQWKVGESFVALTKQDVYAAVWETDSIPAPDGNPDNPTWRASSMLTDIDAKIRQLQAAVAVLAKVSPDVDEAAIVQGVLAGLAPETIAGAVVNALPADLARQVVDEITSRLAPTT